MSDPARFLNTFAQALAAMTLYRDGHPARERAVDAAYQQLHDLQAETPHPLFTFLGDEVVYGRLPLREMKDWDWGRRLAQAGVQRLEFEDLVGRDDFEGFLQEVLARLTLSAIDSTEARQMRRSSIRFGAVGLKGEGDAPAAPLPTATITFSLGEEAETMRWLQRQVQDTGAVPLYEAEAVVRSLAIAMHGGGQHVMLPLLQLKEFDQYTTTHSMNVAVLSMALAEFLALSREDVRGYGMAGLLHDIGKTRIPIDVLTKPGKLTDEERALMNEHPAAGARLLLESDEDLDLAIVVAYEHHVMINGGGYPALHYRRACHQASTLVHVCDVYDALRTRRPYREAWGFEQTLRYLDERRGLEFDVTLTDAFVRMMRQWEPHVAVLSDEHAPVPLEPAAKREPGGV